MKQCQWNPRPLKVTAAESMLGQSPSAISGCGTILQRTLALHMCRNVLKRVACTGFKYLLSFAYAGVNSRRAGDEDTSEICLSY